MLDEFGDGLKWRAENGLKPRFCCAMEKALHKLLPGTNIKTQPNIESKVKNWKEKYGVLTDMSRLSGFGWNRVTQSIDVDDEHVWAKYEKFHPKAKGMNGKAFPMYESWQVLFGKDQATGELAEDAEDIEVDVIEVDDISIGTNECYTPRFENGEYVHGSGSFPNLGGGSQTGNPATPTSNANTSIGNPPPKKGKKMSRADAKQAALNVALGTYLTESR